MSSVLMGEGSLPKSKVPFPRVPGVCKFWWFLSMWWGPWSLKSKTEWSVFVNIQLFLVSMLTLKRFLLPSWRVVTIFPQTTRNFPCFCVAVQELDKKFQQTAAYRNMKEILTKKNEQIKEIRKRLQRLAFQRQFYRKIIRNLNLTTFFLLLLFLFQIWAKWMKWGVMTRNHQFLCNTMRQKKKQFVEIFMLALAKSCEANTKKNCQQLFFFSLFLSVLCRSL